VDVVESLAQLALFADLTPAQLEAVVHTFDEEVFSAGQRVLRQGLSGGNVYVIIEGEASVQANGQELRQLSRGDVFGELAALTDRPPSADVVATTMLRCFVIPGPQLEEFLLERPRVLLRLLRMEARRLQTAGEWRG
jgi:CRP/FNR family transcriptional regulator, cyclic AMP receptor protein